MDKENQFKKRMDEFKETLSKDQDERVKQVQDFIEPIYKKIIEAEGYCNVNELIGETCAELDLDENDYHLLMYWGITELDQQD